MAARQLFSRLFRSSLCSGTSSQLSSSRGFGFRSRYIPVMKRSFFDDYFPTVHNFCRHRSVFEEHQREMQRFFNDFFASNLRPYRYTASAMSDNINVRYSGNNYEIELPMQDFSPADIKVKVKGDSVIINANHSEQTDEYGTVSREMCRNFLIPEDVDMQTIESVLFDDGVLLIRAKLLKSEKSETERVIDVNVEKADDQLNAKQSESESNKN